tara:strand:- start:326 stop:1891 length:1566 start_codon:yes stop_codon:yes gene_type:complete
MMDDSDFNLNETRSEPVETTEASKEFEIPPALPSDYSAKPSNSFEHIVDSNQKSLTTTSWGNSVHDSLANKPMIMLSREAAFPPEIIYAKMFITGLSGSGKSWTTGVIMEEFARLGLQFICFDALGAHKGLKQLPNVVEIVPTMELHPNMERFVDEIEANPDMSAVIDCSHIDDQTTQKIVAEYVEAMFKKRMGRGIMTFFEECQDLVPQQKPSLESYGPIVKMCKKGRQYGYGVCLISQRPSEIAKPALTQCTIHIIHGVIQTRDLMAVKEQIAQGTDRQATNSLLDKIRNFDTGELLIYSPSLVPDMTGTRQHYLITAARSDRATEHSGENVVVQVKNHSPEWSPVGRRENPHTVGNMRVHFDEGEDYNPYSLMEGDKKESKRADTPAHQNSHNHIANTNNATSFEDLIDADWSADDYELWDAESDNVVEKSWDSKTGAYFSPFSYDGIEEEGWSADLASEARNLMPTEDDSPFLQSIKVLSAVLLTAGGLFLVLKVPTPTENPQMLAEQSRWLEALEV